MLQVTCFLGHIDQGLCMWSQPTDRNLLAWLAVKSQTWWVHSHGDTSRICVCACVTGRGGGGALLTKQCTMTCVSVCMCRLQSGSSTLSWWPTHICCLWRCVPASWRSGHQQCATDTWCQWGILGRWGWGGADLMQSELTDDFQLILFKEPDWKNVAFRRAFINGQNAGSVAHNKRRHSSHVRSDSPPQTQCHLEGRPREQAGPPGGRAACVGVRIYGEVPALQRWSS